MPRNQRNRFLVFFLLLASLFLSPSTSRADWSLTISSPSGYVMIAGGTVVAGVTIAVGALYIAARGRIASSPLPDFSTAFAEKQPPPEPRDVALKLDLVNLRF